MNGRGLKLYAYAFGGVGVLASVQGKEIIAGTALICGVVVACTWHVCRTIEAALRARASTEGEG